MNPEAEKLRSAMQHGYLGYQWLHDNADTVAELVDAAMDAAASVPPRGVVVIDPVPLRRLSRAVVDFEGPQEPPEPERREHTVLYCPEPGCTWWRAADVGPVEVAYRIHYREMHQGGKP